MKTTLELTIAEDLQKVFTKESLKDVLVRLRFYDRKTRSNYQYILDLYNETVETNIMEETYYANNAFNITLYNSSVRECVGTSFVLDANNNDEINKKDILKDSNMIFALVNLYVLRQEIDDKCVLQLHIEKSKKMNPILLCFDDYSLDTYSIGKKVITKITNEALTSRLCNFYGVNQIKSPSLDKRFYNMIKPYIVYSNNCNNCYFKLENKYTYIMMRHGYLTNLENALVDSEIEKYFNKGNTLEEISKVPLSILKQKQPVTLNNYINLVKIQKRAGLEENNRVTMLNYDVNSQETINLIIETYKLDPNKTVAYIDNCINYQGISLIESLSFFKNYLFKLKLLNSKDKPIYPEGLKAAYYRTSKELVVAKKINHNLIYDKQDEVLKTFIKSKELKIDFYDATRSSRYSYIITGPKTAVLNNTTINSYYTSANFSRNVVFALEEGNLLNFYLRTYYFSSKFDESFPILQVTKKSEDSLILSVDSNSNVVKLKTDLFNYISLLDVKELASKPHLDKIPFVEIMKDADFNALLDYLDRYQDYEPVVRRGLYNTCFNNVHYLSQIPAKETLKKTLYFLNKSHIDHILTLKNFKTKELVDLKVIYDHINYMDIEIIDHVNNPMLSRVNIKRFFEEISQTKDTLKATFAYLKEQVDMYQIGFINREDVIGLYLDYLTTCRLMEVKPERFPKDVFKAHDTMMSIYQVKKDEIKEKRMRELSDQLKELEYEDGEYAIVVPKSTQDLVEEGAKLSHCVSTYIDRVIERKTTIFLVRKKEAKDEPFYTLEIVRGMKNQLRGKYNCQPTEEVDEFTNKWISKNADKLKAI